MEKPFKTFEKAKISFGMGSGGKWLEFDEKIEIAMHLIEIFAQG